MVKRERRGGGEEAGEEVVKRQRRGGGEEGKERRW